jgi:hypothetical protein
VKKKLLSQEIGKRSGVVNNNGELKLRMPFLNYYQVKIFPLNCISKYRTIAASEGSYVSSEANFKQTIMDLNAREGAEIKIDLDVEK